MVSMNCARLTHLIINDFVCGKDVEDIDEDEEYLAVEREADEVKNSQ